VPDRLLEDGISHAEAQAWDRGANTALRSVWLAGVLRGRLAPGMEVLELGTRTGLLSEELTRAGLRMCGAESAAELAAVAAARKLFPTVIAAPGSLPFGSGRFGAVVSTSLREYEDPEPTLAEVSRVLRPGGQLLIAVRDPTAVADDPIGRILRPMRERLRAATHAQAIATTQANNHTAGHPDATTPPDATPAATSPVATTPAATSPVGTLAAIMAGCARLGLATHTERLPPHGYLQSPAGEARDIANRATSLLWGVTDATWAEVVVPALDALLSLPDPERPMTRYARYSLTTITASAR
jgi:SAM-dependent methyltransferase